ncbi:M1 family metallopeptidase [Mucilaginibacter pedocola]|uniref:Peptidase M1 membrane alanine aminopeptidase domain-containing protein n=1 Tax=Mucilaginibacter pedocola TaxID=1792845 RepID=A0A1S9PGE9_9SPHI|nr:M1 family metallopeptidase [Mucilaginibacter pedocola]OOQ60030.1 hypothetical protein BC343_27265 [Mucilaginibacter pedocola]
MLKQFSYLVFGALFISSSLCAQQLPVDRNTQKALAKGTRTHMGIPGKKYWQNTGDYLIDVKFDPETRKISGEEVIDYVNNSPDTLKTFLFKLYPNLYKANSARNTNIATADLSDGVRIETLTIDGKATDSTMRRITGTNMLVKGIAVLPGAHARVTAKFSYTLNKGSFNRTGQITDGSYFIAYFFPRIAVYDDVDGWNEYPYLGKEEFYNDYGNFKVNITVPGEYRVWATGDLKNTNEVYEPEFAGRIAKAELSDSVVDVITTEDIKAGNITKKNSTNTWKFEATNVTDFAFAVSANYVWKASSIMVDPKTKRRTRVDAVFNPDHKSYWPVVNYARKTVEQISYHFPGLPFPYPHITIVDGLDAMEYPMMVNNLPFEDDKDVVEFTAHEVFHTLFPFYVGTNETKYSFMDEGWATLTEFLFHPKIAPDVKLDYDMSPVNDFAGLAEDVPVMTPTAQLYGKARFADKDLKPALALYYLKEMLGEKVFLNAMREYITTWAGKHPTPYDFFNSINTTTGQNLNWYWKSWYFDKAIPDLAISGVLKQSKQYGLTIKRIGNAPVPVHITIIYADNTKTFINRTVAIWAKGAEALQINIPVNKRITKITLGGAYDADVDMGNNVWVSVN